MSRYFIGPELFWVIVYFIAVALAKSNVPPSKSMDNLLESFYLLIPLVALFSFAVWYLPGVERSWMIGRFWIAGLVGGHLAMAKGLDAYSEQGPGIGTAYIVGMGLLFVALIIGTVIVLIFR